MIKKQVIFVQGFGDYSDGAWPVWLGEELTKCGFVFNMLSMPDVMCPEVNQWLDFLLEQKIKVDKNTYFVGHSLGCITIARYLEKLPEKTVAGGCIMVAGFCSLPKVPLLSDFCDLPLDFSEVKKHAAEFVVIMSDNDHFIPCADSEDLARRLGARVIVENKKGHFKEDIKELPSVLNTILEMDQMWQEMEEIKKLNKVRK